MFISRFNEDVSSLNSLEDLLSFSGITSDTNGRCHALL